MFPFGRKRDPAEREEKERRKRDKREKQGQALESGGRLSTADLQRLEEVRRSLASKGGQPITSGAGGPSQPQQQPSVRYVTKFCNFFIIF